MDDLVTFLFRRFGAGTRWPRTEVPKSISTPNPTSRSPLMGSRDSTKNRINRERDWILGTTGDSIVNLGNRLKGVGPRKGNPEESINADVKGAL